MYYYVYVFYYWVKNDKTKNFRIPFYFFSKNLYLLSILHIKYVFSWVYLEPVFGSGTLQQEQALFKRIDKDFRFVMREIEMDPRVTSLTKINNISTIVNALETQLARCQQNLMSYITVSG